MTDYDAVIIGAGHNGLVHFLDACGSTLPDAKPQISTVPGSAIDDLPRLVLVNLAGDVVIAFDLHR